jgi:hypothetical protein
MTGGGGENDAKRQDVEIYSFPRFSPPFPKVSAFHSIPFTTVNFDFCLKKVKFEFYE